MARRPNAFEGRHALPFDERQRQQLFDERRFAGQQTGLPALGGGLALELLRYQTAALLQLLKEIGLESARSGLGQLRKLGELGIVGLPFGGLEQAGCFGDPARRDRRARIGQDTGNLVLRPQFRRAPALILGEDRAEK